MTSAHADHYAEEKIKRLAAQLADAEQKITAAELTERRDSDHPLMNRGNRLIVELIGLDAGYRLIAKIRGVPASTNRGLCRVPEGASACKSVDDISNETSALRGLSRVQLDVKKLARAIWLCRPTATWGPR